VRTSALFGAKRLEFFEIYGMSARTRGRGWASADIGQVESVNFSRFCADAFVDGPILCFTKLFTIAI